MAQVRYTRNLFLRGICIIYLFAFLSFYIQIPGLYGDDGILPARTQADVEAKTPLLQKFVQKPTFVWLAPYLGLNVEYTLDILALLGSIAAFAGFVSQRFCVAANFVALWSLYYSLCQVGQTFARFPWDSLLLEAGFLCVAIAPLWYPSKGKTGTPSDAVTFWTVRWLLFRVLFSSGVTKLTSGYSSWWNLEALGGYFESQGIPTPLAWYAHQLPAWYLRLNTVAANVLELAVPFLFFFPNRKVRLTAFYLEVFLQIHVIATGNWNFYNFLIICLSIALLDDQFFYRKKSKNESSIVWEYFSSLVCLVVYGTLIYGTCVAYKLTILDNWTVRSEIGFDRDQLDKILARIVPISIYVALTSLGFVVADSVTHSILSTKGIGNKIVNTLTTIFYTAIVCFTFALSVVPFSALHVAQNTTVPAQLRHMAAKVDHLRIVNAYGLSRRMIEVDGRPEIIIEGSNYIDGPWKEYEFLYKPGNVNHSMPFVAPHQPRLDWQMWQAAAETYHQNPWIMSLTYRLLAGQPEVLALVNDLENPFRNEPPKYIRASLYRYHYVPWSSTWNDRTWWTRERVGEYFPIFSRDHPPLLDYLAKMKIIRSKPPAKITNEPLKLVLDGIRSLLARLEPSLLLWSVFTAGCAIIMTSHGNSVSKKKYSS